MSDLPPIPLSIGDRAEVERKFAESGINKDGLEKMLSSGFAFRRNSNGDVEMAMHWRWANGRKVAGSFSVTPYGHVLASDPAMRVPVVVEAMNAWNDLCGVVQIGRIKFPIEMETSQGVEKFRDVMDMAMRYCDLFDEWGNKMEAERQARLRTERSSSNGTIEWDQGPDKARETWDLTGEQAEAIKAAFEAARAGGDKDWRWPDMPISLGVKLGQWYSGKDYNSRSGAGLEFRVYDGIIMAGGADARNSLHAQAYQDAGTYEAGFAIRDLILSTRPE